MSKRIVFDEPYAGDESVVGTHKLMPDPLADQLIAAGMAHLAGSKEDAEAQAERDHKAAVTRTAEKEAAQGAREGREGCRRRYRPEVISMALVREILLWSTDETALKGYLQISGSTWDTQLELWYTQAAQEADVYFEYRDWDDDPGNPIEDHMPAA
jgi:hypothetical protein